MFRKIKEILLKRVQMFFFLTKRCLGGKLQGDPKQHRWRGPSNSGIGHRHLRPETHQDLVRMFFNFDKNTKLGDKKTFRNVKYCIGFDSHADFFQKNVIIMVFCLTSVLAAVLRAARGSGDRWKCSIRTITMRGETT